MARVTDEQIETVRALIGQVPPGRVTSYGAIAGAAGLSSARTVGWIMRTDSADLPWHRVLRSDGRIVDHKRTTQAALLRAEGVLPVDGRVDIKRYGYLFD